VSWSVCFVVAAITFILFFFYSFGVKQVECSEKGGVLIQQPFGFVCVKPLDQ
jgi:hypothetical protein